MDWYTIVAETFGFIATFLVFFSTTRKNDNELIMIQGGNNILWMIHYGMLNAWSAVVACVFGFIRIFFVFKWNTKKQKSAFIFVFFLFCLFQFFFIESYIHGIPIISIFLVSYGTVFLKGYQLTLALISANSLFLVYSIYIFSISSSIKSAIMVLLLTYRWFRINKK